MRSRILAALPALALALAAAAGGGRAAAPAPILLGAAAPLSGPSAHEAALVRGAESYFRYVNARGGVHGRAISYRVVDTASDPALALEAARQLVERDGVLAVVGSPGTEPNLAARDYLNRAGVPQLFVGSGAALWARGAARYRWSLGYQPTRELEGSVLGRFVARTRAAARVAVLAQTGPDGVDLLAGLRGALAGSRASVAAVARHDPASPDLRGHVARLRASGADVLALLLPPAAGTEAAAAARRLGWRPMLLSAFGGPGVDGAVSTSFLKDPTDPRWSDDPGMRLYRALLARYAPGADARDVAHVHGMAVAHTTVELLRAAGPDPSRAAVIARARSLRSASNPFLLPGIAIRTSEGDAAPVEQAMLRRRVGASWRSFGGLWR